MTSDGGPGQADGAQALRGALRQGLTAALKARDPEALAALRTAVAALDNAEAVPVSDALPPTTSAHIAGARSGLGAAEAARRELSADEVRDILRGQVSERRTEADRYDALGQADAARRLRRQADTLAAYLP